MHRRRTITYHMEEISLSPGFMYVSSPRIFPGSTLFRLTRKQWFFGKCLAHFLFFSTPSGVQWMDEEIKSLQNVCFLYKEKICRNVFKCSFQFYLENTNDCRNVLGIQNIYSTIYVLFSYKVLTFLTTQIYFIKI